MSGKDLNALRLYPCICILDVKWSNNFENAFTERFT